jgi:hypothetical protein
VDYSTLIQFALGNLSVDFDLKPANDNPVVVEPALVDEMVDLAVGAGLPSPDVSPSLAESSPVIESVVCDVAAEQPVFEPVVEQPAIETVPEPVAEMVLADVPEQFVNEVVNEDDEDDIPDVVAALFQKESIEAKFADVQVVNAEGQDVIMVDFDREKDDLAQKFRKKLFDKRKRS